MAAPDRRQPIATLWTLTWDDDMVTCVVYRAPEGFQLSVESPVAVIVTERFNLEPRALSRAQALRESLTRRGWREAPAAVEEGDASPTV